MTPEERRILRSVAVASRDAGRMVLSFDRAATVGQHRAWWSFLVEATEQKILALLDALEEAEAENKRLEEKRGKP